MYIKAVKKQPLCSLKKQKVFTTYDNTFHPEVIFRLSILNV